MVIQDCYHFSQESQFQRARKPQIRFASGGFAPWTPKGAQPLYPAGGLGGPQTPRFLGGLRPPVPSTYVHSPATSNHFDNPGFIWDRILALHITLYSVNSICLTV